ncbi:ferric-dicitrate binding protein FerR, regulates iron transport through sigma-19 [Catalinimonas alkaloidigena]|uniref:Ferric-dicitrate binding protein FerR, regulates iron transport through sigma-19 n=1 Tax=Catalinimonas alkaloidigena TaxID=1075417 RepID=A0A1G9TMZ6_9BACT|nr:FecR domain-containing protein [Catalinimonas alkaloidigena]SDM48784.1 ferric-dicitrate binding protein FerR, regulates iron transport through sigma-19 [Catalinimonas alkaloidigena]
MNYQHYTTQDFMMDDRFQQWVQHPTPASDAYWEAWLANHPEKTEEVEEARRMLRQLHTEYRTVSVEKKQQQLARLHRRLAHSTEAPRVPAGKRRHLWRRMVAVAAMFLLLVGGSWYYFQLQPLVYTASDSTQVITLPDGSQVTLNAHASLRVPRRWSAAGRHVWLTGQGFFEVEKQQTTEGPVKFTVHTSDLDIQVLGTRFDVNQQQTHTQVVLEEGSVQLRLHATADSLIRMQPGDYVQYSRTSRQLVEKTVNPKQYTAWLAHKLVFDQMPLHELAGVIQQTYGRPVIIRDSTAGRRNISGTLPSDDLEVLLEILQEGFGVSIVEKEDTLILQ